MALFASSNTTFTRSHIDRHDAMGIFHVDMARFAGRGITGLRWGATVNAGQDSFVLVDMTIATYNLVGLHLVGVRSIGSKAGMAIGAVPIFMRGFVERGDEDGGSSLGFWVVTSETGLVCLAHFGCRGICLAAGGVLSEDSCQKKWSHG